MTQVPIQTGRAPSTNQEGIIQSTADYWRKVGLESPIAALARTEDAAKQLVGLNGLLQGIYFAVFAFSDLRSELSSWQLLLFFLPIMLWLGSLYCATQVFVPGPRSGADIDDVSETAWQGLRATYFATLNEKLHWLNRAHQLLLASFGAVLVLLGLLALLPRIPAEGPTPIIVITPTSVTK